MISAHLEDDMLIAFVHYLMEWDSGPIWDWGPNRVKLQMINSVGILKNTVFF